MPTARIALAVLCVLLAGPVLGVAFLEHGLEVLPVLVLVAFRCGLSHWAMIQRMPERFKGSPSGHRTAPTP